MKNGKLTFLIIVISSLGIIFFFTLSYFEDKEIDENLGITYGKIIYITPIDNYRTSVCYKYRVQNKVYLSRGGDLKFITEAKIGKIYKVHYSLNTHTLSRIFLDSPISSKYDTINFNAPQLELINDCGKIKPDGNVESY